MVILTNKKLKKGPSVFKEIHDDTCSVPKIILLVNNQLKATTDAAIEASLASASSDRLVITTGAFPPKTTPAAQAPIK